MKSRHLRLWLAAIIIVIACGLLLASAWPVARVSHTIAVPRQAVVEPVAAAIPLELQPHTILVVEPEFMRVDDEDQLRISLAVDEKVQTPAVDEQASALYASHNVVAVARLELPGLGAWSQNLREPLSPGGDVAFHWTLRAVQSGTSRGVLWLYLEVVPKAGGEVQKVILLSRPVRIEAVTILGLPARMARWVGGGGLAGGLLYVLFAGWFSRRMSAGQQRRSGSSQTP